jgi:hypothetical protein
VVVGRKRLVQGLIGVQIADGVFNAIPTQWLKDDLDHLGVPYELRAVFPIVKGVSAAGLLAGLRWPSIGRATAGSLVAYFVVAMGFHARAKDGPLRFAPAASMLAWSLAAVRSYPAVDR